MKKYQFKIGESVYTFDDTDWVIPGTITAIDNSLYCVEYDAGGYDWLLADEIRPIQYRKGQYVKTMIGVGKIIEADSDWGLFTVSYGKLCPKKSYYEFEISPVKQPSLITRLLGNGMYLYD